MRIAVIGANGRLGQKIVRECLARNHEVVAVIKDGEFDLPVSRVIPKSLFDLTREDIADCQVLLSAFGSGFKADPKINKEALVKLADLVSDTSKRIICIGGAGLLYEDKSHTQHVYQGKYHPAFLKGISENILLGLEELRKRKDVTYTLVCPSLLFDYEGKKLGHYQVGRDQEVIYSKAGQSRISYADLAAAMVDEAEQGKYKNECITICEE